jgi:hypothetical protein
MSRLSLGLLAFLAVAAACDRSPSAPIINGPSVAPLLARTPADPTPTVYVSNDASFLFRGDGIAQFIEPATSPFHGLSRYQDGECGVNSNLFAKSGESGDLTMQTAGRDHSCAAAPRNAQLTFMLINADGSLTADGAETIATAMNVHQLETAATGTNPALYVPRGTTVLRGLHLGDSDGKCFESNGPGGLAFRPVLNDGVTYVGADDVQVSRNLVGDTWTVASQPDEIDPVTGLTIHHDKAYCRGNGKLYHVPVSFVIKASTAPNP